MCILFLIVPGFWGRNVHATIGHGHDRIGQLQAEILFPCLAFTIAAVVSLVSCYRIQFFFGYQYPFSNFVRKLSAVFIFGFGKGTFLSEYDHT